VFGAWGLLKLVFWIWRGKRANRFDFQPAFNPNSRARIPKSKGGGAPWEQRESKTVFYFPPVFRGTKFVRKRLQGGKTQILSPNPGTKTGDRGQRKEKKGGLQNKGTLGKSVFKGFEKKNFCPPRAFSKAGHYQAGRGTKKKKACVCEFLCRRGVFAGMPGAGGGQKGAGINQKSRFFPPGKHLETPPRGSEKTFLWRLL